MSVLREAGVEARLLDICVGLERAHPAIDLRVVLQDAGDALGVLATACDEDPVLACRLGDIRTMIASYLLAAHEFDEADMPIDHCAALLERARGHGIQELLLLQHTLRSSRQR